MLAGLAMLERGMSSPAEARRMGGGERCDHAGAVRGSGLVALPLRSKLLYGTSRIGIEALGKSQALWLVYYYAPPRDANLPTLVPSLAVGLLLFAAGIVGALDEAIVGYFSDRTCSRWGRRIPYILVGAPLAALFFVLLFTAPASSGAAANGVYLFFIFGLVALFGAVAGTPYEALLPEIAPESRERVQLQAIKVFLGVVGTAVGLVGSDFLQAHFGFKVMALSIAGLALVCQYVGIAGVWGPAKLSRTPATLTFREALRATFRNAPFRILLPSVVLFALAFQLLSIDIPFYVHAVVGKHDWLTARLLLAVAIAAAIVCVPLFMRLAQRTSKRGAYRLSMLAAALAFPLLGFAGLLPGIPAEVQILVAAALIGAPIGAHFLFPVPLTADVIDYDSGRTKLRREASYLGASTFVERTATSFAPLMLVLLRLLGDTRGHTLGVRLVGPVGGLIILAAYLLFRAYDVPDEVRERVEPQAAPVTPAEVAV
jgi:glycoside/pentoside/hexuronide:cation symporter, GPH family